MGNRPWLSRPPNSKVLLLEKPDGAPKAQFTENNGYW